MWHHLFKGSKVSCYGTSELLNQENVQIYKVWQVSLPQSLSLFSGMWMVFKTSSRALRGYTLLFSSSPSSTINTAALTPLPPTSHNSLSRHLVSISAEITDVSATSTTIPSLSTWFFLLHCVAHFQAILND